MRREVEDLLKATDADEPRTVTEDDIEALPGPVRRYLRYTGTVGREYARTMRIEQKGSIRLKPGGRWLPFTAEQYYSADPVAFVWSAKVKMGPFTLLRAMDRYREGKGHMIGKLISSFTVVDGSGKEMDQGSLLRFLSEMMWFPSVYLSDRIQWEEIDEQTAKATIMDGGMEASATLHFDGDSRLADFVGPRYRMTDTGFELDQWSTPISDYRMFGGRRLPGVGSAVWNLETGDFTYIKIELTEVEINPR
ncbi:MAG: hypothetical protein KAQ96_07490 [Thermoplasmata archaeon]|nr:hypothetical protein [Thermoplasmata archaeon]